MDDEDVVARFHRLYYDNYPRTWENTYFLGVPTLKCPLDLWVYQEMLWELRPDVIVECGTASGGSAYYLATVLDLVGKGRVVTIDIEERPGRPSHARVEYVAGSSTDPAVIEHVRGRIEGAGTVMVILDSDHSCAHVARELELYAPMVTVGGYLVVEDTNVNGHPVSPDFGPGPWEAVDDFLERTVDFVVDTSREKFFMTFNPRGFLRRVG